MGGCPGGCGVNVLDVARLQVFGGSVATLMTYWQLGVEFSWVGRLSSDWSASRFACLHVDARTRRDVGRKCTWWVLLLWCKPDANHALVMGMIASRVCISLQSRSPSFLELNNPHNHIYQTRLKLLTLIYHCRHASVLLVAGAVATQCSI